MLAVEMNLQGCKKSCYATLIIFNCEIRRVQGVTKKKLDCCYKNFNTTYFDNL